MFAGAKGGSSSFKQTPDNLRSNDTFEGVLGLCVGPIKGPTRGLKSIKIDGTPIENETGQLNFQNFTAPYADGDPLKFPQRVQLKLGAGAAPSQVGLALRNEGGGNPVWITRTLANTNASFVDLRMVVQQLFRQDAKGIYPATATIEIQMKPVGSTEWVNPTLGTATATYKEEGIQTDGAIRVLLPRADFDAAGKPRPGSQNYAITGKTTGPAVYELRIGLPNEGAYADTAWDIRLRLLERESYTGGKDNSDQEERNIVWESMAAVYGTILGEHEDWRGLAWLQLYGKASDALTGVPEVIGEYDTKVVSVPSANVYNPDTRQYTPGVWDGSWAKAFTTDPAWIINDAISDELSGISLIARGSYLNKWDALELSKHCSELVPDGNGGTEPRYSMNIAITQPQKAEEFVRYLAGAVGALAWDQGDGEWRCKVDKADAPSDIFTLDNIEGEFVYSHTEVDTRFNDIIGKFKNAEMDYREDAVQLFDNTSIATIGRKPTTIVLVGCTSRQEAMRRVKLRLRSTVNENRIVTFTTNRRGRNIEQLSTILIADGDLGSMDRRTTGRTVAVAADRKSIVVRDAMYVAPGMSYKMWFTVPNPTYGTSTTDPNRTKPTISISRNITNTASQRGAVTTLYLDEALPDTIADNLSVALEAANLPTMPRLYRVTSVMPQDDGERVAISAINIDTGKWASSDNVSKQDTVYQDLRGAVPAPTTVAGQPLLSLVRVPLEQGSQVNLQASWVRPAGAFLSGFRVQYAVNGGALQTAVERQQLSTWELPNAGPGLYRVEVCTIDRRGGFSPPLLGELEVTQSLIDATEIKYAGGETLEEMKPNEPGSDVTGNNTSKDTNAVGGVPAPSIIDGISKVVEADRIITEMRADLDRELAEVDQEVAQVRTDIDSARSELTAAANVAKADAAAAKTEAAAAKTEASQAKADLAVEVQRAKDDTASIRTVQEQIQRDVSGAVSSVREETTNRANADSALSNRLAVVEAGFGDGGDINARISEEATARANADSALALRASALETIATGADGNTKLRSSITDEALARSNADSALATRTSTLETSSRGAGNMLPATEFGTGATGWTITSNAMGLAQDTRTGTHWEPRGETALILSRAGLPPEGAYVQTESEKFAVRPGSYIQFSALLSSHRSRGWLTMFFFRSDQTYAGYAGENFAPRYDNGGPDLNTWDQTGLKSYRVPDDAAYAVLAWRLYTITGQSDPIGWMYHPYVGEAKQGQTEWNPYSPGSGRTSLLNAYSRITDEATSRTNADSALATRSSTLEAQLTGTVDSGLAGAIREEATARVNAVSAVANRATSLEARATSAANQLAKTFPGFENKFDNWSFETPAYGPNAGDIPWEDHVKGAGIAFRPGFGSYLYMAPKAWIKTTPGKRYRAGFWIWQYSAPSGYGGATRLYWEGNNKDYTVGAYLGSTANPPEATQGFYQHIPNGAWHCYASDIQVDDDLASQANSYWIRPRINLDGAPAGSGYVIAGWFFREVTGEFSNAAKITEEATARADADSAIVGRTATMEAQFRGETDSGLKTLIKDSRQNLAVVDWWKKGAAIPWTLNGGQRNEIVEFPHGGNFNNLPMPDGSSGDAWLCQAGPDPDPAGGWFNGRVAPLDPDKTYRFAVPIAALTDSRRTSYWGTGAVCDLNTTNENANPYFAYFGRLPPLKWHMFVGYIFPRNSAGKTHAGAGVWDMTTGAKIADGWNYCFHPDGRQPMHRAYQFYADNGAYQAFGRPVIECVDGSESPIFIGLNSFAQSNARITDEATLRTNADSALAGRANTLEAQFRGDTDSPLFVRLRNEETARANADSALGTRASSLEARSAGGGNLVQNSQFVPKTTDWDIAGWIFERAGPNFTAAQINWPNGDYYIRDENVLASLQVGTNQGVYAQWYCEAITVSAGDFLQYYVYMNSHRCVGTVFLYYYDALGNLVGNAPLSSRVGPGGAGNYLEGYVRIGFQSVKIPPGVSHVRLILRHEGTANGNSDGYCWFTRPYVGYAREGQTEWNAFSHGGARPNAYGANARIAAEETARTNADSSLASTINTVDTNWRGANDARYNENIATSGRVTDEITARSNADSGLATRAGTLEAQFRGEVDSTIAARIRDEATARANADSGIATRTSSLETRAGGLESRVGITETAVSDLKSGTAAARLELSAVTPGGVAQITLKSSNNGGAAVEIVGNVTFKGNLDILSATSGGRMHITNQTIRVYDDGGTEVVTFGRLN